MVGTSGSSATRLTASTASPRNFPALILAQRRRQGGKGDLGIPGDGRVDRLRGAGEGDVHDVEAEFLLEQFARQMRRRADAGSGETVFVRVGLDQFDQLFDALRRHRRIDRDDVGRIGDHGDRREILDRVVGDLGVQAHIDHEAGAHHGERVAVGRRLRHFGVGDIAAGAGFVIDVELLAKGGRQFLPDDTGDHIGGSAGGEADQQPHRMIGILAGGAGAAGNEQGPAESQQAHYGFHDVPPAV